MEFPGERRKLPTEEPNLSVDRSKLLGKRSKLPGERLKISIEDHKIVASTIFTTRVMIDPEHVDELLKVMNGKYFDIDTLPMGQQMNMLEYCINHAAPIEVLNKLVELGGKYRTEKLIETTLFSHHFYNKLMNATELYKSTVRTEKTDKVLFRTGRVYNTLLFLLNTGFDVNTVDNNDRFLLIYLMDYRPCSSIKINPVYHDVIEFTDIGEYAPRNSYVSSMTIVELLLSFGADINMLDKMGLKYMGNDSTRRELYNLLMNYRMTWTPNYHYRFINTRSDDVGCITCIMILNNIDTTISILPKEILYIVISTIFL